MDRFYFYFLFLVEILIFVFVCSFDSGLNLV